MKTTPASLTGSLLSLIVLASAALAAPPTDDAVKAAEAWLNLVDAAEYEKSWTEAAGFFKERVKETDWVQMVELARKPFGKVESRKLLKATHTRELPGAPDGEYVVIQFQTAFSQKKNSVETITPMKEPGGSWRVSGYYIK